MINFKTLMICFKIIIYIFLLLKFQLVYSQVIQSNEFAPFNKHLDVKGISLVGMYDVTDDFLIKVSKIIESCFEVNEFTDKRLQKRLNRMQLEDLPNEMILKVMGYLEMKDLLRYSNIQKCLGGVFFTLYY